MESAPSKERKAAGMVPSRVFHTGRHDISGRIFLTLAR